MTPCGHPRPRALDVSEAGGLLVVDDFPCAWPGCWDGVDAHTVRVTVPGRGTFTLRRAPRRGEWVWKYAGHAPGVLQ